jgi:lipopolysaccharide/colanic/teichoic acid biosynthesis glycosyltransferase
MVAPSRAEVFVAPRRTVYSSWIKRPLDVALAVVALVLVLPVMVVVAVLIPLLLGPGGILYRQQRVGRNGQPFTIYKFRSMLQDRRVGNSPTYIGPERRINHKCADDPRHRPFGRLIRSSSIDELPQLLNVIRGEMSLVGPRPELCHVAYREGFLHHPRHLTRPGLTGAFQVSPLRSTNRISSGLHLDVDYVTHVRFARDLAILLRTVLMPFIRRGS